MVDCVEAITERLLAVFLALDQIIFQGLRIRQNRPLLVNVPNIFQRLSFDRRFSYAFL